MPIAALIPLITALAPYGLQAFQFIGGLIKQWETKGTVSADEWNTLSAPLNLTAADHAAAAVRTAGLDPANPAVVAFLALTK